MLPANIILAHVEVVPLYFEPLPSLFDDRMANSQNTLKYIPLTKETVYDQYVVAFFAINQHQAKCM